MKAIGSGWGNDNKADKKDTVVARSSRALAPSQPGRSLNFSDLMDSQTVDRVCGNMYLSDQGYLRNIAKEVLFARMRAQPGANPRIRLNKKDVETLSPQRP